MPSRCPEDTIQRAVFEHLALRGAAGVFAFHPANGGYRHPVEAAHLKGLGVRPGVPDLIAIHRGQVYAIELKTEGGRATDTQLEAIDDIRAAGGHAQICRGLDHALAVLESWGLLRGRTT
jgi:VRR-NUC domain